MTISWWYVYETRVIFYETGLYRENSAYIYDLYKDELMVIKSVCDYADNSKSDRFQKIAAYTSSQFAKWLMENKLEF